MHCFLATLRSPRLLPVELGVRPKRVVTSVDLNCQGELLSTSSTSAVLYDICGSSVAVDRKKRKQSPSKFLRTAFTL
ncbi:hypothetical protein D8674_019193 [Pyrus ussuriensis x Pyrus communis]|uniref:Uncharacterized protein n=1 Tax=Pyrus ussuriensis x Pyrus communis TaxID=2448454 RepID=A0A5N5GBM9_9ROSA|nr:hypothetical protein D8674_019193 [Pyrus ussuriensis x Pyrus communis]